MRKKCEKIEVQENYDTYNVHNKIKELAERKQPDTVLMSTNREIITGLNKLKME